MHHRFQEHFHYKSIEDWKILLKWKLLIETYLKYSSDAKILLITCLIGTNSAAAFMQKLALYPCKTLALSVVQTDWIV